MQKNIIKYMLSDFKTSIIAFVLTVIAIIIFLVPVSLNAEVVSFNGGGFACMIFMFVAALSTLPMGIRYMNQSGFSRKTSYKNFIISFAIIALGISVIMQIMVLIFNLISVNGLVIESEYNLIYGGLISNTFFISIAWLFLAIFLVSSIGFFISMLYQRMGRGTKIGVSCGFPIFFMLVFPLVDTALFDGTVYSAFFNAFMFICGFYKGNSYPLLAMGMFILLAAIIYGITYFTLVRKLNFK